MQEKICFGDYKVFDAPNALAVAMMYADQYEKGEPGYYDPKKLCWLKVTNYPISRLKDAVDA